MATCGFIGPGLIFVHLGEDSTQAFAITSLRIPSSVYGENLGENIAEQWIKFQAGRRLEKKRNRISPEVSVVHFKGLTSMGRRRVSPHNPVRWQLIIPRLLFRPYPPLAAHRPPSAPTPAPRSNRLLSPYAPNRAFSTVPPELYVN